MRKVFHDQGGVSLNHFADAGCPIHAQALGA
jgi:hypothetical protein